jgi:hypothetical protein
MTQEEFYNLYDKIRDILYGFKSYHCWYFCCNEEYNGDSMSFEVHVNSDQGDGDEWVEYLSIDDKGRIHSEDAIYENYEEFLREW